MTLFLSFVFVCVFSRPLLLSFFFLDNVANCVLDVEEDFIPWLMKEVKKEMGNMIESRELLMGKYIISN